MGHTIGAGPIIDFITSIKDNAIGNLLKVVNYQDLAVGKSRVRQNQSLISGGFGLPSAGLKPQKSLSRNTL